ncbi:LOW QUALITY PROTEIN: hypothetical protein TorRG33x02_101750, partial [Trema orientale]
DDVYQVHSIVCSILTKASVFVRAKREIPSKTPK